MRRKCFTNQFFLKNRLAFGMTIIAMILLGVGQLLVSWLLQIIIDVATGAVDSYSFGAVCGLTLAVCAELLLAMVITYYSKPLFLKRAMKQYKDYVFQEMTKKGIHSFQGENTSTYLSALTNDIASIENGYLTQLFSLYMNMVMFVGAFGMMLFYSPQLTLAAILLTLLPIVAQVFTGNCLAVQEKQVSDQNAGLVAMIKDALSGFAVVKSFQAEREIFGLFTKRNTETERSKQKKRKTEIIIQTIGQMAGVIAQFGVFLFGAHLALNGKGVTAGVVIVFVQLMNYVIQPIAEIPQILAGRKAAYALIDKLADALDTNVQRNGTPVDRELKDAIEVKELTFGYEPEKPVLNRVNARFEAGKSYAVVGGSGSGKSTLLHLLMGGQDRYLGEISFDGRELKTIDVTSLYDLVSIIQQNVFVFNSTIRENITMFKDFSEEQLKEVMTLSGLNALVEAKGGDYLCGENGNGLSGGEKQRISIARCLLRETPVLLADEATAALDAATAFAVNDSILKLSGLTRIVVTHHLEEALLRRYDSILVMRNGSIAEEGTFEELMKQKGYFYSLYTVAQA